MVSSAEIALSINSIEDDGAGNVIFDIYMNNNVSVSAFQFQLKSDSTDILSFRSFCSYENSFDEGYLTENLCVNNGYDWLAVVPPDSGRADTSGFIVLPSIQGNIYGYLTSDSISIGDGLLTRVSARYDTTNINTPVNMSIAKPNCDPNFDGNVDVLDISIVADAVMGTAVDSIEVYNCINISLDIYLDSPDQTVANEEYIDATDVGAWIALSDYFGGMVELIFLDNNYEQINDVKIIPQTWLVGQGILGCTDYTACNYNLDAIVEGECEYSEEGYGCDGEPLSLLNDLIPEDFNLHSIYPNPFNPKTTISFSISEFGFTTITAYDINGRQLETLTNGVLSIGNYSINWNASSYPSGVYLIRMDSGDFTQTQKVVLVK